MIKPTPRSLQKILTEFLTEEKLNAFIISKNTSLAYPVVYRTLQYLHKEALIQYVNTKERGPKSPKNYLISPYGYVEAFLHMGRNANPKIFKNSYNYCPRYLTHLQTLIEADMLDKVIEVSQKILPKTISEEASAYSFPTQVALPYPNFNTRNSIDTMFLFYFNTPIYPEITDTVSKSFFDRIQILEKILENDPVLLFLWDNYFIYYLNLGFQEILKIDEKLHKKLPRIDEHSEEAIKFFHNKPKE